MFSNAFILLLMKVNLACNIKQETSKRCQVQTKLSAIRDSSTKLAFSGEMHTANWRSYDKFKKSDDRFNSRPSKPSLIIPADATFAITTHISTTACNTYFKAIFDTDSNTYKLFNFLFKALIKDA